MQNLTDGFDVILDIHDLKTHPEYLKELFYEKLRNLIQANCRYIFNVISDNRIKPLRELEKSAYNNHSRIRTISYVQEAEDFLENDLLLNSIFYN